MNGIPDNSYAYFTHSYRAAINQGTVAVTEYGGPFCAAVESENIMGVQFHPEKSGPLGLTILRNFVEL
jgi:glutamine amidotransferase